MKRTSMKMMDFAAKDPRSVAAQLRGIGDGREEGPAAMYAKAQKLAARQRPRIVHRGLVHLFMGTLLALVGIGLQNGVLG